VGIGSAGPVDPAAGTISPVNLPALRAYPIAAVLADAYPGRPVRLAGDGHCMALGEYWRTAPTSRALLGVVVSTGVGGGLVLDGHVQLGPTGNAGHVGHFSIDLDGPRCSCGGRGCVETYASGPAMVRWAIGNGWAAPAGTADAIALAAAARAGEPVAVSAFRRCADALALAVISVAAVADLDDVVIGGGVVNGAADLVLDRLRARIAAAAGLAFVRRVRVAATTLGADAGLYGAAAIGLAALPG
jgi:glucokinase